MGVDEGEAVGNGDRDRDLQAGTLVGEVANGAVDSEEPFAKMIFPPFKTRCR